MGWTDLVALSRWRTGSNPVGSASWGFAVVFVEFHARGFTHFGDAPARVTLSTLKLTGHPKVEAIPTMGAFKCWPPIEP